MECLLIHFAERVPHDGANFKQLAPILTGAGVSRMAAIGEDLSAQLITHLRRCA
jgi:hypothetical protein